MLQVIDGKKRLSSGKFDDLPALAEVLLEKLGPEAFKQLVACEEVTVHVDATGRKATVKAEAFLPFLSSGTIVEIAERREVFDPGAFLSKNASVFAYKDFRRLICAGAERIAYAPKTCIAYFDILRLATDEQIRDELPTKNVFESMTTLCWTLSNLMISHVIGVEEHLLTDGRINICYVQEEGGMIRQADISFEAAEERWLLGVSPLGVALREPGRRVFSASILA